MARARRRRSGMLIGGGLALAIAALVGMWGGVPQFGLQSSLQPEDSGSQVAGDPDESPTLETPAPSETEQDSATTVDPSTTEAEMTYYEDGILTILVEDRSYAVRIVQADDEPQSWYQQVTLEEAISMAQNASGDEDGMKVRVLHRESARASAEHALEQALDRVGLSNAVLWQKPFVD